MKLRDFLSVVDLERLDADDLQYLRRHLLQSQSSLTQDEMCAMYGNEAADLEIEQQRADLARTHAEVMKLRADADRARAEADAQRVGTRRRS